MFEDEEFEKALDELDAPILEDYELFVEVNDVKIYRRYIKVCKPNWILSVSLFFILLAKEIFATFSISIHQFVNLLPVLFYFIIGMKVII